MYINGVLVGSWSRKEVFMLLVVHRFKVSRLLTSVVHGLYGTVTSAVGVGALAAVAALPVEPVTVKGENGNVKYKTNGRGCCSSSTCSPMDTGFGFRWPISLY